MTERTNKQTVVKTIRFDPTLISDMEKVITWQKDKYPSMTAFISLAMANLIKSERRVLEQEGLVWDHLTP